MFDFILADYMYGLKKVELLRFCRRNLWPTLLYVQVKRLYAVKAVAAAAAAL